MLTCSSSHLPEQIRRAKHGNFESLASDLEICDVMCNQSIGLTIDGSFENHFVIWIAKLGAPSEMNLNRIDQSCQFRKKLVNVLHIQSVSQTLLRSFQYVFVLQEKRGCCLE